jgi:outer membrane protein assembly factor BamA
MPRRGQAGETAGCPFLVSAVLLLAALASAARAVDGPRVAGVRIEGNRTFSRHVLVRWMTLQSPGMFTHSDFSTGEFLSDLERLRRAYRGEGFLAVRIEGLVDPDTSASAPVPPPAAVVGSEADSVWLSGKVRLRVRIDEGPRWKLTGCELRLAGPESTPALHDSLLGQLELSRPGPYRLRAVVTDRERLERIVGSRALLDARVRPEASRDDSCHLARLRWSIETGPRARYAGVRVYGLDRVHESTVAREVAVRPGHLLRATDIESTRRNLLRTGLFPEVEVIPAPGDSGLAEKHLVIIVRERPGGSIGPGFGFGTSDHARILLSLDHRNLDGRGLRLSLRAVYGERRRGGEGEIVFPWFLGHRLSLAIGGGHERTSRPSWTAELTRGSLHLARQLGSQLRGDLGYALERQQLLTVRAGSGAPGRTRVGTFLLGLARDTRDDLRRPRQGSYLHLEQDWSVPWLGGLHHFARTDIEGIRHRSRGPFTVSLRGHAGWIAPQAAGSAAPVSERYFAGGLRTIRGFPEDGVGPRDAAGDPAGGRLLATGTVESRCRLFWLLGGSLFVDAGDLVDHANALAWRNTSVGAGGGLFLDSPVGRVRLYLAFPVTSRFRHAPQVYAATGAAF